MRVAWTEVAQSQLRAIYEYVAADSIGYAKRLADRITRRTEQLTAYPKSGGIVVEYESPSIRELLEGPYRIIYRVRPDRVDVVAVIHGARLMPDAPPT